MVHKNIAL